MKQNIDRKKKKISKEEYAKRVNMIIGSIVVLISIILILVIFLSYSSGGNKANPLTDFGETSVVSIKTDKGDILLAVYPELMPKTVDNFLGLVDKGFYNNLTFHRVEDWVIQGGDPKGDGTGGSEKTIELETNLKLKNTRGMVAMARTDAPNSATSQFYILKKDAPSLDGKYAVFGKVLAGMEVVDQIQPGSVMTEVKKLN